MPIHPDGPNALFVYGTLMRGQCRERFWPRPPRRVLGAQISGALYDLGEFPALTQGDERIAGELWIFDHDDMPDTLRMLDEVEAAAGDDADLYRRRIVECLTEEETQGPAWTYYYARPEELDAGRRMTSPQGGLVDWRCRTEAD